MADAYGGLHPFTQGALAMPPATVGGPYWPGWDIVRGVAVMPDGSGGFVLDGFGGLHGFKIGPGGVAPTSNGGPYWNGYDIARGVVILSNSAGIIVDGSGGMHFFGINGGAVGSLPPGYPVPYFPGQDIIRGVTVQRGRGRADRRQVRHGAAVGLHAARRAWRPVRRSPTRSAPGPHAA